MSLILTIVGSVFAAIFLVGALVLAYGTWHYFSLVRVARYKRGTHGLKLRHDAWGMLLLTATSGALASVIFVLLTGSQAVSDAEISPLGLMAICLEENDRRFAGYDRRLLRPTTTPTLARLALRVTGWFRRSVASPAQEPTIRS